MDLQSIQRQLDEHREILDRIDHALNGNGKPGLKVIVDRHEQSLKFLYRVFWIVGSPLLGAIGLGLLYLLRMSH